MGETYQTASGGDRGDGAAFGHTPVPTGEGKPKADEADEGARTGNVLEKGDLLAGKFTSQDELIKAYNELQAKLGGREPEPDPVVKPDLKPAEETDGFITKAAEKGIDFDALNAEFADTGELTAETMATLTKRGIPQEMVEAYIQGQQSLVAGAVATLSEIAGGKDNLGLALEWATENLSDAEIDAYNGAMKSGNVAMTTTLLRGIVAAFRADVGEAPRNLVGEGGLPAAVAPFRNSAEQNEAMQDKRYSTDTAYRDSVIARIAAGMGR